MERVLVVDDEKANLSMVRRILRVHGYELAFAQSGAEALEKIENFRPDLIILDIMMAGMDGYEVCRHVKGHPASSGIMVLLLSARSSLADRLKGYAENADDFLAKPFEEEELLARVHILLRLKAAIDKAHGAEKQKSEFLATMSHEIRTPMGGMIGMLELLERSSLNEEQVDCVNTLRSSADSLLSLLNGILDFSKIEAGKIELDASDFNLMTLLDNLNDILGMSAAKKGLDYTCIVDSAVPLDLCGDGGRIRQILLNLGGNAIKFTHSGQVCLRIKRIEEGKTDIVLSLSVEDSGIGIPKKAIPHLFDSYTQAGKEITGQFGGTGLGLSISRDLVRLMAGDVHVESTVGVGSVFRARIRLAKQENALGDSSEIKGMRILYADLNENSAKALGELCKRWSCELDVVSNSSDTLSAMGLAREQGKPYQAVLLGYNLHADGLLLDSIRHQGLIEKSAIAWVVPHGHDLERAIGPGFFPKRLFYPLKMRKLFDWLAQSRADLSGNMEKNEAEPLKGSRILLADDNEISLRVAMRMLEKLGCSVTSVTNGKEALAAYRNQDFDLVFVDNQMPEMDGLETTQQIRQSERLKESGAPSGAEPKRVPIIALTGSTVNGEREKFMEAGADDYILKPVTIKNLEDLLTRNIRF
ncbi:MAG: response regulator [Proteobacteria bacterium]|nr:response regulator [Pseudomonadota bacterium]